MANPVVIQHPPSSKEDFDPLPIPPLDPLFLSCSSSTTNPPQQHDHNFHSDLPLSFEDNYDFDITFDDLDHLYFPSETEQFLIPSPSHHSEAYSGNCAPHSSNSDSLDSGSSGVCGNHASHVDKYLNSSPSEAASFSSDGGSGSDSARAINSPSPASSLGSGNGGSGLVSEPMNAGSPDSDNFVVEQKIKVEVDGNTKSVSVSKRKKETSEDTSRNLKYRKAENGNPTNSQLLSEEDEKRRARLMRNRESAQLSRQRKKHYVEELEDKVRSMHSTIAELNGKISFFMAENASLRQQLSVAGNNGIFPPPPPGAVYPPMVGYPWLPCAPPYVVKPPGSQVPLVPIPRLKQPKQPVPAPKGKNGESKKAEGKTKKVASVSFLGLLFIVFLFGGLVPNVDVKFGGVRENGVSKLGFASESFYGQHKGKVLIVDGHSNGSQENMSVGASNGNFDIGHRVQCERGRSGCSEYDVAKKGDFMEHSPNATEQLVASLYVPRNDKLVKIDGNLIIHSVLASERAMASRETAEVNNSKETGLAIPRHLSPSMTNRGIHSHLCRNPAERQKALTSGPADALKDHAKLSAANGKLQQWFREGLAGPMLSSGTCTEVFQFDVSPAPGAIIPASSVANITAEQPQNATNLKKGKNRRILHGLPIPLPGSDLNVTGEHFGRNSQKNGFQRNKSASSMVVSVLVDPREAGDGDVDGMIAPKSLSRIFVVVLLDSIKYVTYSCGLPGAGPHLVTT